MTTTRSDNSYITGLLEPLRKAWSDAGYPADDFGYRHFSFAESLLRQADDIDGFADRVEDWGNGDDDGRLSARDALGLITASERFGKTAQRLLDNKILGRHTRASFSNSASIALSGYESGNGLTGIAYSLMYELSQQERTDAGELNRITRSQSATAVKASSLRVYASSCRVVAQLVAEVGSGKHAYVA